MKLWSQPAHSPAKSAMSSLMALAAMGALSMSCGGSPAAVPTPTPTLGNTPISTPTAAPTTANAACSVDGSAIATCDKSGASQFQAAVQAAIDAVIQEQPALFDRTQAFPEGSQQYKIVDIEGYVDAVVAKLAVAGLCAEHELYEPNTNFIHVKNAAALSEDFAVYTSKGFVRRDRCYVQTCNPASFPLPVVDDTPPVDSGCGKPFPPPLSNFAVKVNVHNTEYSVLDSTPRVTSCAYCTAIGYTDGRCTCPLRIEGTPDRAACENWRVGIAKDTGKPGPTWKHINDDGTKNFCTGPESGCEHDPAGPYNLRVYNNGPGLYRVCTEDGLCGEVIADR